MKLALKILKWPIGVVCGAIAAALLLPALAFVNGFEWAFGVSPHPAAHQ